MNKRTRFSVWLAISLCVSLLVHMQVGAGGRPRHDSPGDTLKSRLRPKHVPGKTDTFKLLPKFDNKRDTSGLQLIPRYYDNGNPNVVPLDREPQIVKKVEPGYPAAALQAGLEGRVIVKIWVDREGKAGKVVVLKSDNEVFNEAAIEAARQFVFTPAYLNNKPVAVWVSYPFRFRLPEKN